MTISSAAASQIYFYTYLRYVAGWETREHQRPWVSALQALADGRLRHPDNPQCEKCVEVEKRWIELSGENYRSGFRACNSCKKTHKLLIPAWPGSGKTNTSCQWLSWLIGRQTLEGHMPQVGLICYSDDVAADRSVAVRDTVEFSERYKEVFPTALPMKGKGWGQHEWFLQRQDVQKKDPTFRASGMNGTILSYRFPTATVIDDPHDPKLVKTEGQREEAWRIYRTAIKTRGAQGVTPLVLVMNRFAEDDLAGRVMDVEKDWVVLRTPARDETGESAWPPEVVNGEPCGVSTEELLELERQDTYSFVTQYLVLPPRMEAGVFRYLYRSFEPKDADIRKIVQFWDTATTTKSKSDYSAMCELWVLHNGTAYVGRVINEKLSTMDLLTRMGQAHAQALERCRTVRVYVESLHAGPVFTEMLYAQSGIRVDNWEVGGGGLKLTGPKDLYSRACAVAPHVEQKLVYFPLTEGQWKPWQEEFENQLMGYDHTPHDDMVAAFVGAMEATFRNTPERVPRFAFSMKGW